MKVRKVTKRIIALLLTVSIIGTGSNISIMADSMKATNKTIKTAKQKEKRLSAEEIAQQIADGTYKGKKLKETKYYDTYEGSDGSIVAAYYSSPVRFEDENGKLRDYDSNLIETDDKRASVYTGDAMSGSYRADEYAYVNTAGNSKQYFPEDLNKNTPILMEKDQYSLSLNPVIDNREEKVTSVENVEDEESVSEKKEISADNAVKSEADKIEYIKDEVTYQYVSMDNGVKENIIISEQPENLTYSFSYTLDGMYMKLDKKTNIIGLYNNKTDKEVAVIPAAYLNDSTKTNYNYDIKTKIKNNGNTWIIEYSLPESYMNDKNTSYPVTLDPTVEWITYENTDNPLGISFVIELSPGSGDVCQYPNSLNKFVIGRSGAGDYYKTYIQFNKLNQLLRGKQVNYAYAYVNVAQQIGGDMTVKMHEVTQDWKLNTLKWENEPEVDSEVLSQAVIGTEDQSYEIDFTKYCTMVAEEEADAMQGVELRTEEYSKYMEFWGVKSQSGAPVFIVSYNDPEEINATYDGSFIISAEYNEATNKIDVSWEDSTQSATLYRIYKRTENSFEYVGKTTEKTYEVGTDDIESVADIRVMAVDQKGTQLDVTDDVNVLSNIVTFKKNADISMNDEEETDATTYAQVTVDTDGDELEDGYEIWDFKTLWKVETGIDEEGNKKYELDSDGDGLPDGYEVFVMGTDPAVASTKDENGKSIDSDGDGFSDLVEYENGHKEVKEKKVGTDPHLVDSDFDGIDDKADGEPRYTNGSIDKSVANTAEVYIGLYDISYSKKEQGVVYNYIKNIYSGLVKQVSVDYGNDELNKSAKYFYDENGNNTAVIESYKNQIGTICITYSYDEDGNVYYVCDQKTKYNMEYNEDGDISEISVDNNKLIKYVEQNLQNNSASENLQVGDVVSVDEIIDSYNNGQKIRKVITSYKSEEEDKYSQKIETYQDDSEKISYLAEYNSNGDIIKFSDYTQDEKNPIVYNYTYENNSIKMQRDEDFEKEVITKTGENDVDTTITNYKFNDVCGENTIYTVTNSIEDNTVMKTTSELFNGDVVENEVNRENDIKTQTLYYGLTDKQIFETELQRKSNISSVYKIDNYNNDKIYEYSYDLAGNIKSVKLTKGSITTENYKEVTGELYKYNYDAHGRIISEYDYISGKYYEYKYNSTGNIRAYWTYALDNEKQPEEDGEVKYFSYDGDWDDQMTKVDGDTIEYDNVGNPINYINGMEFTWENGHNLNSVKKEQKDLATYQYNQDGLRTLKETEDTVTQYTWDQNKLLREIVTYKETNKTYDVWYIYNGNNEIIGFEYSYLNDLKEKKKTRVYYEKNLLGDIISLLDSRGLEIVTYTYDAWGNMRSNVCFEGNEVAEQLNNIGYRGYYRDKETGFYYLRSRYYDPQTTRFISVDTPDDISDTGTVFGYNLYCYCECNPIIYDDENGNSVKQTIRSATYSYNRKKAKKYMKNNWNETLWNFLYKHSNNKEFYHYTSDCANYVSQCLFAGGFKMTSTWYSTYSRYKDFLGRIRKQYIVSEAWRLQNKQREYFLKYYSRGSTVINKNSNLKNIIKNKKIKKGDIIYFNNEGKGYSHAAIIYSVKGGTIRYSAHTNDYLKKDVKDFFKSKRKGSIMVVTLKDSGEVVK